MKRTIAIMQPYFLPYMGYWQLINAVDEFVIYDTIQYTKKGWINRNRFLRNGRDEIFSLPLKKDASSLFVKERSLAENFDRHKLIRQLCEAYKTAPYFSNHFPLFEDIINNREQNLFEYIFCSVKKICHFLDIQTPITKSSSIKSGHEEEKGTHKVLNICKSLGATNYLNPEGGKALYHHDDFNREGISLSFLCSKPLGYQSFGVTCIPHLSILDVMMFSSAEQVKSYLGCFVEE